MASRKTYNAVAAALRRARVVPGYVPGDPPEVQKAIDMAVGEIALHFMADNAAFDKARFVRASQLPSHQQS